jgi:hypothetical protein
VCTTKPSPGRTPPPAIPASLAAGDRRRLNAQFTTSGILRIEPVQVFSGQPDGPPRRLYDTHFALVTNPNGAPGARGPDSTVFGRRRTVGGLRPLMDHRRKIVPPPPNYIFGCRIMTDFDRPAVILRRWATDSQRPRHPRERGPLSPQPYTRVAPFETSGRVPVSTPSASVNNVIVHRAKRSAAGGRLEDWAAGSDRLIQRASRPAAGPWPDRRPTAPSASRYRGGKTDRTRREDRVDPGPGAWRPRRPAATPSR